MKPNFIKLDVGDLVQLQKWCKNKGRIAQVVEVFWYNEKDVKIQYMDKQGLKEEPTLACTANLILLESA